jgi:hypothetical protein
MRRRSGEKRAPALPAHNAIGGKTRMARLHAALEIHDSAMRRRAENAIGTAGQHSRTYQRLLHRTHIIATLQRQSEAEFAGKGHDKSSLFQG